MALARGRPCRQQRHRRGLHRSKRDRRAAQALAAEAHGRYGARGVCPHRADVGERRRIVADDGAADGNGWRIDGRKQFITNARYAPFAIVLARAGEFDPKRTSAGITAFVLPLDGPGVSVGPSEQKLGLRASDTSALIMENAAVGADAVLGEVGKGFAIAMAGLDGGRIGIAAQSVGIARRALEIARAYAKERRQFGRPIADFEGLRFSIAKAESDLAAARLLALRAAWLRDRGRPFTREAAMAKLYASEMAQRATHAAVQILGGNGYMRDYAVERYARDGRATTIYEGTSEIQRIVIARSLLAA